MSIMQEILAWTQGLPAWQSDAVARLLEKSTLTADDLDDLFALLKLSHGIPDPKGRVPKPLTADQIPAPVKASTHVELHAMKDPRHVNAIAEKQRLPVGPFRTDSNLRRQRIWQIRLFTRAQACVSGARSDRGDPFANPSKTSSPYGT
jgi:hypothetical protein